MLRQNLTDVKNIETFHIEPKKWHQTILLNHYWLNNFKFTNVDFNPRKFLGSKKISQITLGCNRKT